MTAVPKNIIKCFVNNKPMVFDSAPIMRNNTVLIPIGSAQSLTGANAKLDNSKKTVTITKGKNNMILTLNNKKAIYNGKPITLPEAPTTINNIVYLPLNTINGKFGVKIIVESNNTLRINY
jgi:hypothetical protein